MMPFVRLRFGVILFVYVHIGGSGMGNDIVGDCFLPDGAGAVRAVGSLYAIINIGNGLMCR